MPLIQIIVVLCVVGVLLWLIETYLPLDPTIKRIIQILVIVVIVLWLLQIFGLLAGINSVRVGR
jgi:hypothetical protein